jgi:4'-phosphopantetheinyl transferase
MSASSPARRPTDGDPPERWPRGPRRGPRLPAGDVHVWRADLAAVSEDVAEALSDDEHRRALRIAGDGARRDWRRARGVLRELLGRYLQCDAAAVRLTVGAHGKPELADADERPLFFNLSHSGELALYAFALEAPIGVDVQVARREPGRAGAPRTGVPARLDQL